MTPQEKQQFEQMTQELGLFQLNQLTKNSELEKQLAQSSEAYIAKEDKKIEIKEISEKKGFFSFWK